MHHLCTSICVCVRARASTRDRLWGWDWGWGWCSPGDCLRYAKGAPDGDPQVVWFPRNRMWRGSRAALRQPRSAAGVGPRPPILGGTGAAGAQDLGRQCLWVTPALSAVACEGSQGQVGLAETAMPGVWGLKNRGGQKPTAPGIPRRSPIQVLTRPDPA